MRYLLQSLIAVLLLFNSCQNSNQELRSSDKGPVQAISNFEPASFNDPDRLDKIRGTFPAIDSMYKAYMEEQKHPGIAYGIVVDGELVHSGSYGVTDLVANSPVNNDSEFHIASMTKSFTSMAIVKLRDEGKLSLDDPVVEHIPELRSLKYLTTDASHITIKNLMTMSTGFPEDNPWADRQLEDSDEEFMSLLSGGLSFSNIPSQSYEYSNLGYAMLGTVITRVSGIQYQDYITENIFRPLGMNDTYWEYDNVPRERLAIGYRWEDEQWKEEPILHTGAFGAIGGMITSVNDFAKYITYHLSAWPPRNDPETGPIKRSSLREMQTPSFPRLFPNDKDSEGNPCPVLSGYAYGLGYRRNCEGEIRVSHSGGLPGYGCEWRMYPDYGFGIVSFTNRTYGGTSRVNSRVAAEIFGTGIEARQVALSEILAQRESQVKEFLRSWDDELGDQIFAENFYMDESKRIRKDEYDVVIAESGMISEMEPIMPINQLRGTFLMRGENTDVQVFFTLSPEKEPKVQALYYWNVEKGYKIEL